MGMMHYTKAERDEARRRFRAEERKRLQAQNRAMKTVSERIADRVIGKINNDIVRPGPKPEERECTTLAQELRDLKPELVDAIFLALKKPPEKVKVEITEETEL